MAPMDRDDPANSETWELDALQYRTILGMLGHRSPECFPGEPEDCGGTYADHVLSLLAAIKARAQFGINHLTCESREANRAALAAADGAYEHWLKQYEATEGCGRHGRG